VRGANNALLSETITEFGVPIAQSLKIKPLGRDQVVSETFPAERMRLIAHNIDAARFQLIRLMKEIRAENSAETDQEGAEKQ
jgi:hypothetical protein